MNPNTTTLGSAFKAAFVLLVVWFAYQGLAGRDFTAPSTASGTAPVLR